jgi:transposase
MPAKYVRPYSKGQKNDFRDAEAIAEAVRRPTMKFVATKTVDRAKDEARSSETISQLDGTTSQRLRDGLISSKNRWEARRAILKFESYHAALSSL